MTKLRAFHSVLALAAATLAAAVVTPAAAEFPRHIDLLSHGFATPQTGANGDLPEPPAPPKVAAPHTQRPVGPLGGTRADSPTLEFTTAAPQSGAPGSSMSPFHFQKRIDRATPLIK